MFHLYQVNCTHLTPQKKYYFLRGSLDKSALINATYMCQVWICDRNFNWLVQLIQILFKYWRIIQKISSHSSWRDSKEKINCGSFQPFGLSVFDVDIFSQVCCEPMLPLVPSHWIIPVFAVRTHNFFLPLRNDAQIPSPPLWSALTGVTD